MDRNEYMRARAAEVVGHAPGCVVGHESGGCSCGMGSSGHVSEPMTCPTQAYLEFVRDQARILAKEYERCGLRERARHFRLRETWAVQRLEKLDHGDEAD